MATGTENFNSDVDKLHAPKIGNTNNDAILSGFARKYRVFECVINPEVLKFYNEIKQYIMHFDSLEYLLTVEHFNQKRQHYHMLIKFKTPIKLNADKMHHCHFSASRKGFKNIFNYITCQDKKHKSKGVYFKIIDEINNMNIDFNVKKYEKQEVETNYDDWDESSDEDRTEYYINDIIDNIDLYYKNWKPGIYDYITYTHDHYFKIIRIDTTDVERKRAFLYEQDTKQKKILSCKRLYMIEDYL